MFETQGFQAIGTTSAGVAASLGYRDGERVEFHEYLNVIRKIIRHVNVPVSVDIESGFASAIQDITNNVKEVLHCGAVGINIEDENHGRAGGFPLQLVSFMVQKIQSIRAMSEELGLPVFINAKTDAVWLSVGDTPEAIFEEAVSRANAYGAAGADCVFVPGDLDLDMIKRLVKGLPYPLNIVVKATTPSVSVLRSIGVKRVSLGSGPMRATMGLLRTIAKEVLSTGTYRSCIESALPYEELQHLYRA